MGENLNIFAVYTAEDKDTMLRLLSGLEPFDADFNVSLWNDNPILQGQQWKPQIEARLNQTDIFLLFVSDALMHSQFVQQIEFKWIIDRYKEDKSVVIPILVEKCQWNIAFEADDYTFSFKELNVLPEGEKPIGDWNPQEQAYANIVTSVKEVISSFKVDDSPVELEADEEEGVTNIKADDQITLDFNEEEAKKQEALKLQEEIESKRKAEEERRAKEEIEARRKEEETKRIEAAAEEKRITEEKKRTQQAEIDKKGAEENKRWEEAEAKRIAEEENKKWKASQEKEKKKSIGSKKRLLLLALGAILAFVGIKTLLGPEKSSENTETASPEIKPSEIKDSVQIEETKIKPFKKEESFAKPAIGESYEGGIVFSIDSSGKSGKIVQIGDAGPMPWQKAIKIHEQLGEGWRLPTFNELVMLYQTVGQGADNSAEFSNGLYWSATDYDEYQARLLRFRDGNTSYHYNKNVETRRFLVRAVRDFSR
ncbi:TIR domain-containing protein [Maribacter sp. 2308TA10-17]|uniref:TIR domain-containing protein n=1 Tax=Maribacter sp. 2308TA10-17 TaxID=3386276 RepID=UPI0039BCF878